MMTRWGFGFISLGCLAIAIYPLQANKMPALISGLVLIAIGIIMLIHVKMNKKKDGDKK